MPVAVPGAAVSPGTSNCNLVKAPALIDTDELVLDATPPFVRSEAVTVAVAAVLHVTLKVLVPATNAALAGKIALLSLEVIPTVSVDVLTRFQLASTALTVTLKPVPAVWAVGVPVLPAVEPGAAVSPGNRTCSFASAPTLTVMDGLKSAVIPG